MTSPPGGSAASSLQWEQHFVLAGLPGGLGIMYEKLLGRFLNCSGRLLKLKKRATKKLDLFFFMRQPLYLLPLLYK